MIPAVSSAERPGPVFVFSPPPTPPRGRVPRAALPTRPGGPRGAPLLRCARSSPPRPAGSGGRWRLRSPGPGPAVTLRFLLPEKGGGREGGRRGGGGGEGRREGAGGGGPGTGGLEGARQQPGRREPESERGPGRAPSLPSPAAARAEAAARQRASEQAVSRTERLERPTLLRVPLTPTRGSALPFYPAPSRPPGKPGVESGAGAGHGADSLPSPHKGGGERTSRGGGRPSAAFARQRRRRRLRRKPGPEPSPLWSLRRLPPGVPILICPLPAVPRGADSVNFTRGCKIGQSPRPRPPRPSPDPLTAGPVRWLLLSTSTALFLFKAFYGPR
ncbi:translation initiation factor IF-2-like [Cebus imitator]|uniref:translation initiation factor IF-2-like n=1 Tax=Cebus imitator TaxID=2715852 RepID=UPI000809DC70|nr:translation initiation factor IF-2-like [Cebus imitator]